MNTCAPSNQIAPGKRAVIYCRVSDWKQIKGTSMSSQEQICNAYARRNKYDVVNTFLEKGESAKTADRTILQELLAFCLQRKNKVNVVIFYKVDRWARYSRDYSNLKAELNERGISIQSATEEITDTAAGRYYENMLASQAQFDNEMRIERCTLGMQNAMRNGRYVWQAPLGFDNTKLFGKANIIPNNLAPIINATYKRISKNLGPLEEIRQVMTRKGLLNRSGKPLSKSQFYRLLQNEVYAGWIVKFGERHKGLFEPIVSQELFDQVQRVLWVNRRRNFHYLTENPDFPLRRFIKHPSGTKLTGGWSTGRSKKYPYYRFHKERMDFKRDKMETLFKSLLDIHHIDDADHDLFMQKIREHLIEGMKDQRAEKAKIEKYIVEMQEQQRTLISKNLKGIISDAILSKQLEFLEEEICEAYIQLERVPKQDSRLEELIDFVREYLKQPSLAWEKAKFTTKIKIQRFYFPHGLLFDGENCSSDRIANIYKAKIEFLGSKLGKVNLMHPTLNTPEMTSVQWDKVADEIVELAKIIIES